jgi:hypothetical protein
MKFFNLFFKQTAWFLFIGLIVGNVYVFVSGIKLGDEISYFEGKTREFHRQNLELEKQASTFNSYQYAASMAADLKFVKKPPQYLESLKYALK